MKIIITGGSKCGKSSFAEDYILRLSQGENLFYLATMKVIGDEGRAVVARHLKMRDGKGFTTIEKERNISDIPPLSNEAEATVLLECLTNLVANEMFDQDPDENLSEDDVVKKVIRQVEDFGKRVKNLIVITNNCFADGSPYDETTISYMRALAKANTHFTATFDESYELVAGIPLRIN